MKIPRQCPLVFLVNVGLRGDKTFGSEEGRDKSGARSATEYGPTALN
jgi:hypothetical protein